MQRPILTFTSDFGHADWFVGVVHGVLHGIAPQAHVVDLNHAILPGDVSRAGFILGAAAPDFPPGTVHLAVVDPGVGTDRRALAVRARGQFFVGPDNGLLDWALSASDAQVHSLTEAAYFRTPVSRTFHGRDVFAPVAAHLANGVAIERLGPRIHDPIRIPAWSTSVEHGELQGCVAYVDGFGNALTNLTEPLLRETFGAELDSGRLDVVVFGRTIAGLSRSYGDAPVGTLVAVVGSSGRIELAQVGGHAAERLGIAAGDPVSVRRRA